MFQTLQHYVSTSKTAEIMSRYRPIAPKPETAAGQVNNGIYSSTSLPHQSIGKSPCVGEIVRPRLPAKSTRSEGRKRSRSSLLPPYIKRSRTYLQVGVAPTPFPATASPAKTIALPSFVHGGNGVSQLSVIPNLVPLKCPLNTPVTTPSNLVTLPLLPSFSNNIDGGTDQTFQVGKEVIDLNKQFNVPEELDSVNQLQGPKTPVVITPRAIRPIGSTVIISSVNGVIPGSDDDQEPVRKEKIEDVEKMVESHDFPVVVTDSKYNVRLENSVYRELVGQPECRWLDFLPSCDDKKGKRIGGEVLIKFLDNSSVMPISSSWNGFTSNVKIEWESNNGDEKNSSVNAFCEVRKLSCFKFDYVLEWKFHVKEASDNL